MGRADEVSTRYVTVDGEVREQVRASSFAHDRNTGRRAPHNLVLVARNVANRAIWNLG